MSDPRVLFTADHHFGHVGILAMAQRPWSSIEDHDEALIDGWNAVVRKHDIVHHVGDFAHKATPQRMRAIFDRLNGVKFLTLGNHDEAATKKLPWAAPPQQITELTVEGARICLCHYAMRTWRGKHRGVLQLYGHSHARLPGSNLSLDVGVDAWGYVPASLSQITQRLVTLPPAEAEPAPESDEGMTP